MLLCMQDYVNLQVALGTKHINSPSVKHRFPSQRSRFYTRGKTPLSIPLMFGNCVVGERASYEVLLRYGSSISTKMSSFYLLRTKFELRWGGWQS